MMCFTDVAELKPRKFRSALALASLSRVRSQPSDCQQTLEPPYLKTLLTRLCCNQFNGSEGSVAIYRLIGHRYLSMICGRRS